jgi:hypothetical protein
MLVSGAALAAVVVLGWSVARALSLTDEAPYWLGSLGIVLAIAAALLILKDLVIWPFRKLGGLWERILEWFAGFTGRSSSQAPQETRPPRAEPRVEGSPRRRQH